MSAEHKPFWKAHGPLGILILIGIGLRFALLPVASLWLDEAYSIKVAGQSLPQIIELLRHDNGSPLFYFILHGWIQLFGTGEMICSLLTVLISCAALIATANLLCEVFEDRRIQLTGVGLIALCPVSIHHATNVRFYSLIVLITALSYLFFYRALRRGKTQDWVLFVVCSLAGLYEHTLYLFVPFAQFILLCLFYRDRLRAGLAAFVVMGLGYLPWIPVLISQTTGYTAGTMPDVIPPLSRYGGPLPAYLHTLADRIFLFSAFTPLRLTVTAGLIVYLVFLIIKKRPQTGDIQHARDFLLAHLLSAGMLVFISLFRPVFWLNKFDLIALPLVFGIAGAIFCRLPFSRIAMVALLAVNTIGTVNYMHWRITGNLEAQRTTIEWLSHEVTADDVLIETGLTHFTVEYYLNELGVTTGPRYIFPKAQKNRPAMIDQKALLTEFEALTAEAEKLVAELINGSGRIYLFRSPYEGLEPLYTALDQAFILERTLPVKNHSWGTMYTEVNIYRRR